MQQRQIAYKVRINDIIVNNYVEDKGEFQPNYVIIKGKNVSRINLIANVIDKYTNEEKSYGSLDLDDGTGVIKAKIWGEEIKLLDDIEIGSLILVIGKIKEYNEERYIQLEIVKVLDNMKWIDLRKVELDKYWGKQEPKEEITEEIINSPRQKVLSLILQNEEINIEELSKRLGIEKEEIQGIIKTLLKEGEIYQPRPGVVKAI